MAQYVFITSKGEDDAMEIPSENDGTILLSTLKAQFPEAIGLKYKVDSRFRAIKLADDKLFPPLDGWNDRVYICTFKNDSEQSAPKPAVQASSSDSIPKSTDLVVLGLPFTTTDNDLKSYFGTFGNLEFATVKIDKNTGRSKGFGFIRFTSHDSALKAMLKRHKIGNRYCDVRIPESAKVTSEGPVSNKVFVGSLTSDITEDDLKDFFGQYGNVTEVVMPKPFREFCFIKFDSDEVAKSLLNKNYQIKDTTVIVTEATPKRRYDDNNRRNFNNRNDNNYNNKTSYYNNNQSLQQRYDGGDQYNNFKKRRTDGGGYNDWNQGAATTVTPNVLQAVVSKAVSQVLESQKQSADPWGKY